MGNWVCANESAGLRPGLRAPLVREKLEELDTHHTGLDDTHSQRPVRARVYRPVPRV